MGRVAVQPLQQFPYRTEVFQPNHVPLVKPRCGAFSFCQHIHTDEFTTSKNAAILGLCGNSLMKNDLRAKIPEWVLL
jgi:hypothetical protein